MDISDFDYELPENLIAQNPLPRRDASRMLVVNRQSESWIDSEFSALPEHLRPQDVLVLNNTRVFPARLRGTRIPTGGAIELLLLRKVEANVWEALGKPARRLKEGSRILCGDRRLEAEVVSILDEGRRLIRFETDVTQLIEESGEAPLPPYIRRRSKSLDQDRERYQTIYAKTAGAIAAPTAGLHFTTTTLDEIEIRGVAIVEITLHVGYGTFEPVRVSNPAEHRVEPEQFSITQEAALTSKGRRQKGGRVIAVGTTTTRALESSVAASGEIRASSARDTDVTIVPGYRFKAVDALLTNFHLPRSSLLILVSAFASRELILAAYRHAVRARYRFYSYGDCMLIL